MLAYNPIIVTRDNYIIDGQHRLQVAKTLRVPIHYTVIEKGDLQTIILLNTAMRKWGFSDYLHAYISLGNPHYMKLDAFAKEYASKKISLRMCIGILANEEISKEAFAHGNFTVIQSDDMARKIVSFIIETRKYMQDIDFSSSRDYVRAVITIFHRIDTNEILRRLELYGMKILPKASKKGYLREFEDILNFRNSKNFMRIY